jgi:hypothetical protein
MLIKGIIGLLIGGIIGFVVGGIFSRLGGTCPLTCNPTISTIYFGILGFLLMLSMR